MEMTNFNDSELVELNFNEMLDLDGGNAQDRIIAAAGVAVVGVTMLAVAATPVGWVCAVGGILGMLY